MRRDSIASGVTTEHFSSFIGIDYSGAQHPLKPLSGLQVFQSQNNGQISKIVPSDPKSKNWCRRDLAFWLASRISETDSPLLVGIDHAMSFPEEYFEKYNLPRDWCSFLDDFESCWPTCREDAFVREILEQNRNTPNGRCGDSRWRRLTDKKSKGAKSVFHFGVPGAVASSTHAGLPWINFIRKHSGCKNKIHFWPFDGWIPAKGKTVIAEVYPALWNSTVKSAGKTQDEHDAWCIAKFMMKNFAHGTGGYWFNPDEWQNIRLTESEKNKAQIEGWILGLN